MFHAALLALLLTEGADCVSSHVGLASPRIHETVLTQNQWVNDGVMAARATAEQIGLRTLQRSHPRWAYAAAGGLLALNGYTLLNNAHVLARYY